MGLVKPSTMAVMWLVLFAGFGLALAEPPEPADADTVTPNATATPTGSAAATTSSTPTATATPTDEPRGPPKGVRTSAQNEVPRPSNESVLGSISKTVHLIEYEYHADNNTFRAVLYLETPETITARDALGPFAGEGVSEVSTENNTNTISFPSGRAVITVPAKPMNGKVGVVISTGSDAVAVTTDAGGGLSLAPYDARDVQIAAATAFAVTAAVGAWRILKHHFGPNLLAERIA